MFTARSLSVRGVCRRSMLPPSRCRMGCHEPCCLCRQNNVYKRWDKSAARPVAGSVLAGYLTMRHIPSTYSSQVLLSFTILTPSVQISLTAFIANIVFISTFLTFLLLSQYLYGALCDFCFCINEFINKNSLIKLLVDCLCLCPI